MLPRVPWSTTPIKHASERRSQRARASAICAVEMPGQFTTTIPADAWLFPDWLEVPFAIRVQAERSCLRILSVKL
jgi:hypothetical protein